jgi:flagellin-like hook-associated protein FlgL
MAEVTLTASMRNNLAQLRATNMLMDQTQNRIATGNKVNTALDDPNAYFKAKGLKDDASDLAVLKDNMGQTISSIQAADKAITSITELVEQAKSLANSAKSETSATERASLASQFDDIREQINTLASDASYGGQNLVTGRGTISGGTFLDTATTTLSELSGLSALSVTGTSTATGDYTVAVQQKVSDLATSITVTGTGTTGDAADVYIDGVLVGTWTTGSVSVDADTAILAGLSSDLTQVGTTGEITVAAGKVLELRTTDGNTALADAGLTEGLQNDATGAQVVNLTSDLGIYGGEVYAHISGYTDSANTNTIFEVSGSGVNQVLTVTDGTSGASASINTSDFVAAGTDTLSVGDLTINFVTTVSTENTNVTPSLVLESNAAVAQIGTVTLGANDFEDTNSISVIIDGITYTEVNDSGGAETETVMAADFVTNNAATILADTGIVVTSTNAIITYTAGTAGDAFTLTSSVVIESGVTNTAVAAESATPNEAQETTYTIPATTIDDGDVYSMTINGTTVSYTALSTDTTITLIAAGLANAINDNITLNNGSTGIIAPATSSAGVITITENNKGTTMTITSAVADASVTFGNESNISTTATTLKSLTTGSATGDARVKVTSGGVTETVNADTSSTVANTVSNAAWGSSFSFTANDATMVAGQTSTISVTNPTGTGENDAQVVFNTDGTSTITVEAVDITSSGLGIAVSSGSWATDTLINATISELDAAKTALRSNSKTMATSLGVITTRETFTENFIDNLRVGADKLTLADGSEEATNMLMLQTRQQLGIQALSMASQSSQSILSLFR